MKLVNDLIQWVVSVLGLLSWLLSWIVSAAFNALFGFYVVGGGIKGFFCGGLFLCLDLAKGRIQITIFERQASGLPTTAPNAFRYAAITLSIYTALSFQMQAREFGAAKNQFDFTRSTNAAEDVAGLRQKIKWAGNPRAISELNIEIKNLIESPKSRWSHTQGCKNVDLRRSKAFCRKYRALEKEKIRSKQLAQLKEQLKVAENKLNGIGAVSDLDPLGTQIARAIAWYTEDQEGISQKRALWTILILSLATILYEIWSGRGLVWSLSRSGGSILPALSKPVEHNGGVDLTKSQTNKLLKKENFERTAETIDNFFKDESKQVKLVKLTEDNYEAYTNTSIPFKDLYQKYEEFTKASGAGPIGKNRFSEIGTGRKYFKTENKNGVIHALGVIIK